MDNEVLFAMEVEVIDNAFQPFLRFNLEHFEDMALLLLEHVFQPFLRFNCS